MSDSKGTALHAGVRQRWSIVTGQDETVREEAEKLVAEAAREAGARHPDNSAAADTWIDLLRREGTYFRNGWAIKQLRVASAKYCSKLASEARNHGNEPKARAFDSLQNRFLALPDPRSILHAVHKRNPEDADRREDRPSTLERAENVQSISRPPLATSLAAPGGESVRLAVQPPTLVESEKGTESNGSRAPSDPVSVPAADAAPNNEPERTPNGAAAGQAPPQPVASTGPRASRSPRQAPRRTADLETSQRRIALCGRLSSELAAIKVRLKSFCDNASTLKREYPDFELWKYLTNSEVNELVDDDFTPKAYAQNVALRTFGATSPETLKKDRRKLKKAKKAD